MSYPILPELYKENWENHFHGWSPSRHAGLTTKVVSTLPDKGEDGTVYLVADSHLTDDDRYDEYIWLSDLARFEKLGNTDETPSQDDIDEAFEDAGLGTTK